MYVLCIAQMYVARGSEDGITLPPETQASMPQKALSGGIPGAVLEPLVRVWSHFVGICRQKLTKSSKNDF